MNRAHKAYAILGAATLFWAGNSIAGKMAVGHASPMVIVTARWVILMVLLYLLNRRQVAADWPVLRPRLAYRLMMGALGFTGIRTFLYYAVSYKLGINSSILQDDILVLVFDASLLLFGSSVRVKRLLGFMFV